MPVRTDRTEARARSLSRGSASTSTTSTRSTNSGWAEQRRSRGGLAGRQPGWGVAESVRLEKTVVEQTLRIHRFQGTLDRTRNQVSGFEDILEEGKAKVKIATREKEAATAEVRRQEKALADAKAVLVDKVGLERVIADGASGK